MKESITEQYPKTSFIISLLIVTFGSLIIYLNQNVFFDINEFLFLLIVWVYPLFLFLILIVYLFMQSLKKE